MLEMQVRRCTLKDLEQVDGILTHPSIYDFISDDGCPPRSEYTAKQNLECEAIYYLLCGINFLTMFVPHNSITYEVHTSALPDCRGKEAIRKCHLAKQWMWDNTPARKIISIFPENNRPALALAIRVGMKREGLLAKSFLKNGHLLDQVVVGLSKEGE